MEALLGKEAVEKGLTEDQIQLFLLATETASLSDVNINILANLRTSGGKEAQKVVDKEIGKKQNAIMAHLVRKTYGKP